MKWTRISEHIWSLRAWVLIPVNVWLVKEEDGWTLVDAGIGPMAAKITRRIEAGGHGPLRRIALTHGHSDHVGALTRVLSAFGGDIPVMAHELEIPYMEGRLPYPRRKKAAQSVPPGIASALQSDEQGKLAQVGGLTPLHAPGHSPGHVVYYHEQDDVMLAGDLFTSSGGRLKRPMAMFTADMEEALRSARIVEQIEPGRLEVCHGGSVLRPAEQIGAYLRQ